LRRESVYSRALTEEERNKRIEEIKYAIPKHADWLEEELKYSNELTLRSRLRELLSIHQKLISSLVDDIGGLVDTVVDTRSYLVHNDPESKGKAAEGKELFTLTRKLRILLEACLMAEIGFNMPAICAMFLENRRYADLIHRKNPKDELGRKPFD